MNKPEYQKTIRQICDELDVRQPEGLSSQEARQRLQNHGPNRLEAAETISAWKILFNNLHNLIVYMLLAAALVSFLMDDPVEGIAILIAVLIAVLFGFFIELKAQHSVESLQKMIKTTATVRRNDRIQEINSEDLVPGDLMLLAEGDSVAADGRLLESQNFACIESALTGESEAVDKDHRIEFDDEVTLGDRTNSVFAGTAVTRGNAVVIVTTTGMDTEVGRISGLLRSEGKVETPLNRELARLGRIIILFAAACAILVITLGLINGYELSAITHIALILAIAAIPEAMPAVSTITLSRGMNIMARHKALVKSLPAVETLGSTTVICTDKTGTLTENQMTAEKIVLLNQQRYQISGSGYSPQGHIRNSDDQPVDPEQDQPLHHFITAAVLCSNATLREDEQDQYGIIGDPTEGALVVLGHKVGITRNNLETSGWRRIGELPFSSEKKYMVTAWQYENLTHVFIKGAPDVLLDMSLHNEDEIKHLKQGNQDFASEGLRVLAIGQLIDYDGDGSAESLETALDQVCLQGLVAIIDPPRADVRDAIATCQAAGIRVKMITGDHPGTASIIAAEVGLADHEATMSGRKLDHLSDGQDENTADDAIDQTAVFARVSPENKLQIVNSLQRRGHIVAMTGDGVNDAPALNGADIGIAMGIRGTEVAKEASDMILTDDHFSTIVDAVREGRIIFANIRKYVYFLFTCNMVEILAIFFSLLFLRPLPILPLHILWLNLVIDIMPAISLGYESGESDVMKKSPRSRSESLVGGRFILRIALSGLIIGGFSFGVFLIVMAQSESLLLAQTATFTMMAVSQLLHILNVRKENGFGLDHSFLRNRVLISALGISISLQLIAIYLPLMNRVLGTQPLEAIQWLIIIVASATATTLIAGLRRLLN